MFERADPHPRRTDRLTRLGRGTSGATKRSPAFANSARCPTHHCSHTAILLKRQWPVSLRGVAPVSSMRRRAIQGLAGSVGGEQATRPPCQLSICDLAVLCDQKGGPSGRDLAVDVARRKPRRAVTSRCQSKRRAADGRSANRANRMAVSRNSRSKLFARGEIIRPAFVCA
jgi:hypothetical protein